MMLRLPGTPANRRLWGKQLKRLGRFLTWQLRCLMTLLITDPRFLLHDTGQHPETADRLRSVSQRLQQSGLIERCTPLPFAPIDDDAIARVHDRSFFRIQEQLAAE